jgi:hypothetical protein
MPPLLPDLRDEAVLEKESLGSLRVRGEELDEEWATAG